MSDRMIARLVAFVLLVLLLVVPARVAAQEGNGLVKRYRLTELTGTGGGESRAYALNNTGQVIGWVDAEDRRHSALWHNQTFTDLHDTVHFVLRHPLFDLDFSESFDISDADQVVGTARTTVKCAEDRITITNAFVLRPAVLTDLGTPYPGDALTNLGTFGDLCVAYDSAATGVSNANHVVGWADTGEFMYDSIRAFILTPQDGRFYVDADMDMVNDNMVNLGTLAASDPVSAATAVNDAGQVTGYSYTTVGGKSGYHAFLINPVDTDDDGLGDVWYTGSAGVNTLMQDLGTLGGVNSWGRDINNDGAVVGESDYDAAEGEHFTRAFYWFAGQMTDLGTLRDDPTRGFSAASAINSNGVIVGWAEDENMNRRAFLYENGQMLDLNDLLYLVSEEGYTYTTSLQLTEARDINDDGLIVGWGTVGESSDTQTRGFLLTPVMVDPNALTEDEDVDDPNRPSGVGGDGLESTLILGTPGNVLTPSDPNSPTALSPLFCGFGTLSVLPLTLLGLAGLRRWGRRVVPK